MLFCELELKFSHKNSILKMPRDIMLNEDAFGTTKYVHTAKPCNVHSSLAPSWWGFSFVCMQFGMVYKQRISFCSSLDKGKTQMFDFFL